VSGVSVLDPGAPGQGCWMLDARYLVPDVRKMDGLGKIGKYKYYRTLRRGRE